MMTTTACVCGHDATTHEHYRTGDDCGMCDCASYVKDYEINPTRGTVSVTLTLGWLIILTLTALVFIGAWVVGTHVIQWIVGA